MSYMFEVYYRPPADPAREAALTEGRSSSAAAWTIARLRPRACLVASA